MTMRFSGNKAFVLITVKAYEVKTAHPCCPNREEEGTEEAERQSNRLVVTELHFIHGNTLNVITREHFKMEDCLKRLAH